MKTGYEKTYQSIVHKLLKCDLKEAAHRLGLDQPVNGSLRVSFLGREYEVTSEGIWGTDGLPSDPCCRGVLVYYVTSEGSGDPGDTYWLPQTFSPISVGGVNISWMSAPLANVIGSDHSKIKKAMNKLGAIYLGSPKGDKSSEHVWEYRILPKIGTQITFLEADEDFPCEIILKLDNGTGRFLEFEQIAFLCGCFMEAVTELCKNSE